MYPKVFIHSEPQHMTFDKHTTCQMPYNYVKDSVVSLFKTWLLCTFLCFKYLLISTQNQQLPLLSTADSMLRGKQLNIIKMPKIK